MESKVLAEVILSALKERKAFDIVKINVEEKTTVADYFIVASARSSTQVKSLSEHVEEVVEKNGGNVLRREGVQDARWIVLDFGDVILHLFNDETRLFYHLERLWGEGEIIPND
ncbi:MAG: ribosome silencing factor [Clostridia bacterium]|jgi:ribosome-associated protein|nr:ribosome silencing factor [Clostridia bacterium]